VGVEDSSIDSFSFFVSFFLLKERERERERDYYHLKNSFSHMMEMLILIEQQSSTVKKSQDY
jgi:hypothetical protein